MQTIFEQMLSKYEIKTLDDRKNAIKEVIQEVVLCGLSRAGFFSEVAFYGGTALRIFYGLDRFSEDLDFSLLTTNRDFSLDKYLAVLENEVKALGLNLKIEVKEKTKQSDIKSAFLKSNTKEMLLYFYNVQEPIHHMDEIKIKFEIDTNPPSDANFEYKFGLMPYPYEVRLYDMPSLFAGKIHAVLCRAWKSGRVKGRDLYDYIFYIS
ncbi:MAG: nucleotidyl transferase AbiEii/AbiGii toxin family protein, partial [Clostridia bacterium]|nr:nucleotidyl transferase AbiEii/AbiGii toxin family protein [Clostridia bacterium]